MTSVVNQMWTYRDLITDQTIMAKVLHNLTPRFDHVVPAIEESNNCSTLTIDELNGFLVAHEVQSYDREN